MIYTVVLVSAVQPSISYTHIFVVALVTKSCLTLCDSIAHLAPQPMGLSRQEYWSGLPFLSPGDLPDSGIETASPALEDGFFATESQGKPKSKLQEHKHYLRSFL